MAIIAMNPATGEVIKEYQELTLEQAEKIIEETYRAFLFWKGTDFGLRAIRMKKAAEILLNSSGTNSCEWSGGKMF